MERKSKAVIIYFTVLALLIVNGVSGITISKVLVLGGNGMLGSATVRSLLSVNNSVKYEITILNRGNWYWDTEKVIKPFVNHIKCSRGDGFRETCTQLNGTTFDTIIDFSTYDPMDLEDILILLGGRFKRYIYVSSDSVYEVCKTKTHKGYSREEDAIRPGDEATQLELNKDDDFGHKKLQGEEALERYYNDLKYEFINLRLPDVLGPRDNTIRFYKYFLWTKLHEIIGPVHIPKDVQQVPISFVFSLDVGSLIANLTDPRYNSTVFNHSYNLAFRETITVKEIITFIGNWLKHGKTKFNESEEAHLNYGFPSVTRGPVDISKATTMLNWFPTDIYTALGEICLFHETMQYDTEYKHILDRVLDMLDVRGDKYRDFIDIHWKKLKDEL